MFDYVTHTPASGSRTARATTAVVSGVIHVAIAACVALVPLLFAPDMTPEVPDMITFVVSAAPQPPPPPPPPAGASAASKAAQKVRPPEPRPVRAVPAPETLPVAAPVEGPAEIGEESVLDSGSSGARQTPGGVPGGVPGGIHGGVPGGLVGGVVGGVGRENPPPPPPPAPVRIGGDITPPRLLHRVDPEYPGAAVLGRVQGLVVLEAVVNAQGQVESVRALRSNRLLEDAAIAAVEQWRYEPLVINGVAHPFVLSVTLTFSLT